MKQIALILTFVGSQLVAYGQSPNRPPGLPVMPQIPQPATLAPQVTIGFPSQQPQMPGATNLFAPNAQTQRNNELIMQEVEQHEQRRLQQLQLLAEADGMDIVLGIKRQSGESQDNFTERRYAYLDKVQSLTSDRLAFSGDKIVISQTGDGGKGAGTQLVRNLIDGVQTEDGAVKNYTVTIVDGSANGTEPVNGNGVRTTDSENKSQDGTGTGSLVTFNINGKGEKVANADGTTGRPSNIVLGHELIHADHNMRGNNDKSPTTSVDADGKGTGTLSREELNTRKQENVIRKEQNVKPRQVNNGN